MNRKSLREMGGSFSGRLHPDDFLLSSQLWGPQRDNGLLNNQILTFDPLLFLIKKRTASKRHISLIRGLHCSIFK